MLKTLIKFFKQMKDADAAEHLRLTKIYQEDTWQRKGHKEFKDAMQDYDCHAATRLIRRGYKIEESSVERILMRCMNPNDPFKEVLPYFAKSHSREIKKIFEHFTEKARKVPNEVGNFFYCFLQSNDLLATIDNDATYKSILPHLNPNCKVFVEKLLEDRGIILERKILSVIEAAPVKITKPAKKFKL